jgi:hypothetical protein
MARCTVSSPKHFVDIRRAVSLFLSVGAGGIKRHCDPMRLTKIDLKLALFDTLRQTHGVNVC